MRRRAVIAARCRCVPALRRGQEAKRIRRIGVLVGLSEDDPGMKPRLIALRQKLDELGWVEGRNLRVERRYRRAVRGRSSLAGAGRPSAGCDPRHSVSVTAALRGETRAIPIVFVSVGDPSGAGFISSLARPGGNLTGFMTFEAGISGEWVTMLKEVMPGLTRAMFVANPKTTTYGYYLAEAEAAARAHALALVPAAIESVSDLQSSIRASRASPAEP